MRERSEHRRIEESIELGRRNVECITGLTQWCRHARIEQVSQGMLAEMTSLPIGLISVSCPHSAGGSSSMNLPWIVPEFILQSCINCQHHQPNGDTSWAEQIIENSRKHKADADRRLKERQQQLAKIRESLRSIPNQAKSKAPVQEQKVVELIEGLFDDNSTRQEESYKQLVEAARIGPELFSNGMIDLLLEQCVRQEFSAKCLRICSELASKRKDYSERFFQTGCEAIRREIFPERAAELLNANLDKHKLPMESVIVRHLIVYQSYYRPIGGFREKVPEYPFSTLLLLAYSDTAPDLLFSEIRKCLKTDNKRVRCDVCGVIRSMRGLKPDFVVKLVPDLVDSLSLDDDLYEDSADHAECAEIAAAFHIEPIIVDKILCSQIRAVDGELQQILISPYYSILHNRDWKPRSTRNHEKASQPNPAEILAFERCWEFTRDDLLEVETRVKAADAIERTCHSFPNLVLNHFDSLLGYLAILSLQSDPPKATPRIVIPGRSEAAQEKAQVGLDNWKRNNQWQYLKNKITDILEKLSELYPAKIVDPIIKCFETTDNKTHEKFKAALIAILGKIGKDYVCQPKVLPILMKGLMDYESVLIRATAVRAVGEAFRYANVNPPENMLDIIVLHLRDQYVAVHKTALHFVRDHGYSLSQAQKVEALRMLAVHAKVYKDKPYDLDDIYNATLYVSGGNSSFTLFALKLIKKGFPTGEQLADEKIVESLLKSVDPDDEASAFVADMVLTALKQGERDRYNSYDHQNRNRFVLWLSEMPSASYKSLKPQLIEVALAIASKDPWEGCLFANLFSRNGDYGTEAAVLGQAAKATEGEKALEDFRSSLEGLRSAALANEARANGDVKLATSYLKTIKEQLK